MSEIFQKIYDEMDLESVICRLPSDMAISALKRRLNTLEELKEFMLARDAGNASKCKEIKTHINGVISQHKPADIFKVFTPEFYPNLFGWMDKNVKEHLIEYGRDELTVEFVFNITEDCNIEQMEYLLERVLGAETLSVPKVTSILRKIDVKYFQKLLNITLRDSRLEVRACVLSVANSRNYNTVSDHQKMIALKAFAQLSSKSSSNNFINRLDFKLFADLKPLERMMALDRYLDHFTPYKKIKVFDPAPSEDELNAILFAGCFEYHDLFESIKEKYKKITELEKNTDNVL